MKKLILSIVALSIYAISVPVKAVTLNEDFSGGIPSDRWDIVRNDAAGAPWTITAPDSFGGLQFAKTADSDSLCWDPYAGIASRFQLIGDFSVSVAFNLVEFPATNTGGLNEAALRVAFSSPVFDIALNYPMFEVLRQADQSQGVLGWVSYSPTSYHGIDYSSDPTTQGTFSITRSGETLSAWIDRGTGPVLLGSETSVLLTGPADIRLLAFQWPIDVGPPGRPSTSLDVRYDNLSIVAEAIVPEPSTLVLLGIGAFGLLAYVLQIQRRKTIGLVLLVGTLLFTTSSLFADTANFDFNSGIGPFFSVVNASGLFNVATDGPDIRISKPADNGTVQPLDGIVAGINSNFNVVGDFTITVDFALPIFPIPNQSQGLNESILSVTSLDSLSAVAVLRYTFPTLGNRIEGFSVPVGFPGGRSSSLMSGQYQLQRSGSNITASFADPGSSSFTQLGSIAGFSAPMSIQLLAYQNHNMIDYPRSTTALDISFDNLSVVADQIQYVPEPSTFVLFGMGAISLNFVWRRRKQ